MLHTLVYPCHQQYPPLWAPEAVPRENWGMRRGSGWRSLGRLGGEGTSGGRGLSLECKNKTVVLLELENDDARCLELPSESLEVQKTLPRLSPFPEH